MANPLSSVFDKVTDSKVFGLARDGVASAARVGQTASVLGVTGVDWLRGDRPPVPKLLRQTFEKLGATYIKLGQFIASSPSLFPIEYVREFEGCLDSVKSLDWSIIEKVLEQEYDRPINEIFSHIDKAPLASASIAQVHSARLVTGEDVVIKVQKPGVQNILLTDFNFLYVAMRVVEKITPAISRASLGDIIGDIQATMLEECDFLKEASNIELFDKFLKDTHNQMCCVPQLYKEWCTPKVLVMERFYGVPLTDLESIKKYSSNPEFTLISALNTWFSSLTECQFFHADLHAGNLMVLTDGRVGFIDFGIVGHIRKETWGALVKFIEAQQTMDYQVMADSMVTIGATDGDVDTAQLAGDLRRVVSALDGMDTPDMMEGFVDEHQINELMFSIVETGKKYGIKFPREFALLVKQFLYFDRYVELMAPDMEMFGDDRINLLGGI